MPENNTDQTATPAQADPKPFVALTDGLADEFEDDGDVEATQAPEDGDDDSDAASVEKAADTEAGDEDFLSEDDRKEFDPNDPAYKAAYAKLLKSYTRKVQSLQKQAKPGDAGAQADGGEARAGEPEQAAQGQGQGDSSGYFSVDFDAFDVRLDPEPEDSPLAGLEAQIDARATKLVRETLKRTLEAIANNDATYRQRLTAQSAQERIEGYITAIRDHPEFDDKMRELEAVAPGTRQLAVSDPDKWIRMAEALTGIPRDWQERLNADTRQSGAQSRRLAEKTRAAAPSPSRGPLRAVTRGAGAEGDMEFDDAFESAFRGARTRR